MNAEIKEPLSDFVCSDCGTRLHVGWECHKCGCFGASTPEEYAADAPRRKSEKIQGKYDDVLRPFFQLMEKELHANCGKGDRPGWLSMTPQTALLEIYYHASKLQKAVKNNDHGAIREYSADVANMSMMLLDVCVGIPEAVQSPSQPLVEVQEPVMTIGFDESEKCRSLPFGMKLYAAPVRGLPLTEGLIKVSVFHLEGGHDPFIFRCNGKVTAMVLADIDKALRENEGDYFPSGPGTYEFNVTRFDGQYGFEGRCELAPGWEFESAGFEPLELEGSKS